MEIRAPQTVFISHMSGGTTILWFRSDLRTADNPALRSAVDADDPVIPVFIWSPEAEDAWAPGGASRVWLHDSLAALDASLREKGSRLILRRGDPRKVLPTLVKETGAARVYWNRRYEPHLTSIDTEVKAALKDAGVEAESFKANLLFEPWEIENKQGDPYKVFTPFWKTCEESLDPDRPAPEPRDIDAPKSWPDSLALDALELRPRIPWDEGIREAWQPGEQGAWERLRDFLEGTIDDYKNERDFPARDGVSRLSPHLHFGEISPRQILHELRKAADRTGSLSGGARFFIRELGWREFAHHVLYHFPHTPDSPLQEAFEHFKWRRSKKDREAWQRGQTGYPIVDAGMRELWETGYMHNRVRMIVASFLVKDLMISWREGARWFWDTLVDADLANNTLGWQWAGGCGADAAPYFRVFNPVTQGKKFDANGEYVRRWIPEIAALPDKWLHEPWNAPDDVLKEANIQLGKTYPGPMVDHAAAREEALQRFEAVKK